jgi:hypothetical protein
VVNLQTCNRQSWVRVPQKPFLFSFFCKPNRTRVSARCTSPYDVIREPNTNPKPNRSWPDFSTTSFGFRLTIKNTANRHVSNAFDLIAVFISFPWRAAAAAAADFCCCCCAPPPHPAPLILGEGKYQKRKRKSCAWARWRWCSVLLEGLV